MNRKLKWLLPLTFWLLLWQGAVWYLEKVCGIGTDFILPAPLLVLEALVKLAGTGLFWKTALTTLGRIFAGLLAGAALGTAIGMATAASPLADCILSPAVRVIRATPVASFILLVILWAPTGRVPAIVAALMVLPVMWGSVSQGIAQTDPLLLEMARAYGFDRRKTLRRIYMPMVLPYFASGFHTSLGLAWKSGVAAEVLCLPKLAVGTQISNARVYMETPELFAWTLVVIALSFLLERGLGAVLERLEGGKNP